MQVHKKLTPEIITNQYLYGQTNTPSPKELVDEKWIRDANDSDNNPLTTRIYADKNEYMENGGGRFALRSSPQMVKHFFANDDPLYTTKDKMMPDREYTKAEMGKLFRVSKLFCYHKAVYASRWQR